MARDDRVPVLTMLVTSASGQGCFILFCFRQSLELIGYMDLKLYLRCFLLLIAVVIVFHGASPVAVCVSAGSEAELPCFV